MFLPMDILISKLVTVQKAEKLNDTHFAKRLALKRRLWGRTKAGELPIGFTLVKAIVQNFPELIPDVIEFLRNNHEQ